MTRFRPGYSLRYALIPMDENEYQTILTDFPCASCDKTSAVSTEPSGVYNLGLVIYREILKQCSCHFCNRFYVVLNEMKRAATPLVLPAEDALARAEKKGLLPNPLLEEGLASMRVAHHQGDYMRGAELCEALLAIAPDFPGIWYNLGCFFGEQGRWQEAVATYSQAVTLDPEISEAWLNQSIALQRIGLFDRAAECLSRYVELAQEEPEDMFIEQREIVSEAGQYGTLNLFDDGHVRRLTIDEQDQGGLYLNPPARRFYPGIDGPGPFSPHFHLNSWLLAGTRHSDGHGLMLGLGCGAGVVTLLHHYPDLVLEVVESDPRMIELVRQHMPLLAFFETKGRVNLIQADAAEFVATNDKKYDFAIIDLFTGSNEVPDFARQTSFFEELKHHVWASYMNVVANLAEPYMRDLLHHMEQAGYPARYLSAAVGPSSWEQVPTNWLIATEMPDWDALANLKFFTDRELEAARIPKGHLAMMQRWFWDDEKIKTYLSQGTISLPH